MLTDGFKCVSGCHLMKYSQETVSFSLSSHLFVYRQSKCIEAVFLVAQSFDLSALVKVESRELIPGKIVENPVTIISIE